MISAHRESAPAKKSPAHPNQSSEGGVARDSALFPSMRFLLFLSLFVTLAAAAAPVPATQIWTLDCPEIVGGHSTKILGAPHLFHDPATTTAFAFDGAHDGLILPVSPLAGLSAFTIELLIRPAATGAPAQRFFHIQDAAGARALLEIRVTSDGRWALDTYLADGDHKLPLLDATLLHSCDAWHWVALHYDGRHMTSYVDGKKELTGEVAFAPMQPAGETSIGVRLNQVYWFKGAIREIRLHPTAIPPSQLAH